jgi:hypothetical protein
MKRAIAVTLLLMWSASVALADGPGMSPPTGSSTTTSKPVQVADGPGTSPPPTKTTAAPQWETFA